MTGFRLTRRQFPFAVALLYAVLGALWILTSDFFWSHLTALTFPALAKIQVVKGLLFVVLSSSLIWFLVHRTMQEVDRAEAARGASEARYRQIFEKSTSVCWIADIETLRV